MILSTILLLIFASTCVYTSTNGYYQPSMVFGGMYHGHPYQMSAFAHKDMIATNMFAGPKYPVQYPDLTETKNESEDQEQIDISTTQKSTRKSTDNKRKPSTTENPDSDEENNQWPIKSNNGNGPSYQSFFPIMFGANGRSGSQDGYPQGPATAIASSFSTGKAGVASSHAVAYGDPYFMLSRRNGQNNAKH